MKFTKQDKRTKLEVEIDAVLESMEPLSPSDEKYAKMADQLNKLYEAKSKDTRSRISPDTKAVIIGNLIGIALILGYEKANVITSKALGFVLRGRV